MKKTRSTLWILFAITFLVGSGFSQLLKPISIDEKPGRAPAHEQNLAKLKMARAHPTLTPVAKLVYVNEMLKAKKLPPVKALGGPITLSVARPVSGDNYLVYWQPDNVFTAVPGQEAVAFFSANQNMNVDGKSLTTVLQIPAPGTYLVDLTVMDLGNTKFSLVRNSDGQMQTLQYPNTPQKFDVGFLVNFTQGGHQELTILADSGWFFFGMELSAVK